MVSENTGFISKLAVEPQGFRLVDAIDYPHSGLFKTLNEATRGNYAILGAAGSAAKFDITQSSTVIGVVTHSNFVIAAGQVFRDGELITVSTLTIQTRTYSATFREPTSGNAYFLIVVAANNALALRGTWLETDLIPNLTVGDIPIAIIQLDAGGTHGARQIQFLTTGKNENNLSIGYNASGYTEKGTFSASASGLAIGGTTATIVTTPFMSLGNGAANAGELRFLEDTDDGVLYTGFKAGNVTENSIYTLPLRYPASNKILQSTDVGTLSWETMVGTITALNNATVNELVTVGATTTELDAESNLKFDGSTLTITGGLSLGAAGELTVTESSDDITIKNTVSDKDLIFNVKPSGADTEFMRIDGSTQRFGINKSAPTSMFNIKNKLNIAIAGTVTTTDASAAINGSGTSFTALYVGQIIKVGSEIRTINGIASDTVLDVTANFTSGGGGVVSGGDAYVDDLFLNIENGEGTEIMGISSNTLIHLGSGIKNNVRIISSAAFNPGLAESLQITDNHIIADFSAVAAPAQNYELEVDCSVALLDGRTFTAQCIAIGSGSPPHQVIGLGIKMVGVGDNCYDIDKTLIATTGGTVLQLVAGKSYTFIQRERNVLQVVHKTV